MKLIIAYIQPQKLTAVKQALFEKKIHKMSVTNALGCGQQMGYHETYRGADVEVNLLKKVRLEIAINAEFVDATVDAIMERSATGKSSFKTSKSAFAFEPANAAQKRLVNQNRKKNENEKSDSNNNDGGLAYWGRACG